MKSTFVFKVQLCVKIQVVIGSLIVEWCEWGLVDPSITAVFYAINRSSI